MPVDISNGLQEGSRDPHALIRINPQTRDAYLPAGAKDWSQFSLDAPDAEHGLTRPIKVSRGLLNNGDEIWVALDEKSQPIWTTSLGEVTGQDAKQQAIWQQTAPKPIAPGASPTQNRKGPDGLDHIYQYNPATGLYDQDLGGIQGVGPPGGKPYIDDGPEAGQSGRRWGWNQQTHAYDRDLGSSPAAQRITSGEANKSGAVTYETRNGVKVKVTKTTENGQTAETVDPVTDKDRTAIGTREVVENGKKVTYTKYRYPDGSEEELPTATTAGEPGEEPPVQVTGSDGKSYIKHVVKPVGTTPGSIYYTDQSGARTQFPDDKSKAPIPAGAPQYTPDWNDPTNDLGLAKYTQAVRSSPGLTQQQQDALITAAHNTATVAAQNANNVVSAQQTEASRATTERGQNATMANQRLSTSSANFGTAVKQAAEDTKYSVGPDAASVLPYYLALGQASAGAYGGLNTPPAVQLGPAATAMQSMPGPWGTPGAPTPTNFPTQVQNATNTSNAAINNLLGQPAAAPAPSAASASAATPAPAPASAPSATPAPVSMAQNAAPSSSMSVFPSMTTPLPGQVGYRKIRHKGTGAESIVSPENLATMPNRDEFDDIGPADQPSGGLASVLGNAPWQTQQPGPVAPTGAGAVAMQQAAGGYNPSPVNQALLSMGIDPQAVNLFGGVA